MDEYLWESYAYLSRYYSEIEQSLPEALAYSKRAFELNENIESVQISYVDNLLQANQIVNSIGYLTFRRFFYLLFSRMHWKFSNVF